MGLDKWLKPEDVDKDLKKREKQQNLARERTSINLKKYTLICSNAKCKYQKIIMKKQLTDNDKNCPRCNKEMKIKES